MIAKGLVIAKRLMTAKGLVIAKVSDSGFLLYSRGYSIKFFSREAPPRGSNSYPLLC